VSGYLDPSGPFSTDPFAERRKVHVPIDLALTRRLEEAFGLQIERHRALSGGEESAVWKVEAGGKYWVVRISPAWRVPADLERVYDIVARIARSLPEVPAPLQAKDGNRVIDVNGHPVSIHPFVDGDFIDSNDPVQRVSAARCLARLHGALADQTWGATPAGAIPAATGSDPPTLQDPDLDAWLEELPSQAWHRSLIHGDFYPRNILWANERIAGVLDWDELVADYREQEVAWSMWEFCQNDAGTRLNMMAAREYLDAFAEAGGTVAHGFGRDAAKFIRRRLRQECRSALVARARGEPFDSAYFAAEVTAFANLKGMSLGGAPASPPLAQSDMDEGL
jgi:homoserine kinase type II